MAFPKGFRQPYYDIYKMQNFFHNIIIFPFSGLQVIGKCRNYIVVKVQKMFYVDYIITSLSKKPFCTILFFFEYSYCKKQAQHYFLSFLKFHCEHYLPNQYSKMREMCETILRLSHSMHFIPFRRLFSVDYIDLKVTVLLA